MILSEYIQMKRNQYSSTQKADLIIVSDAPQWSWNRSPSEDRSLGGPTSANLMTETAQQGDAGMNSLQYGVASQLIPDAFSSLPTLSVAQSPTSVPTCSAVRFQI